MAPTAPASAVDRREFRHTMGQFATGVTVITVRDGETIHGMTANAVTSVSLDPLLVLVCIDNRARMRELIPRAGRFAINVLSERQQAHSRHFAGRQVDGLEIMFSALDGVPILPDNLATLVCTLDRVVDGGDHMVVFGRVDALARAAPGERPLVFYAGDYGRIAVSARVRRLEARQRERLAALTRLAQVVAAGLNVEEVFAEFAQGLATLVPHDAVSVTLLSDDGRSLERFALAASPAITPRVGEAQPLDQTAAGITVRTGKTVVSGDMPGDERFRGENDRRWIHEGFQSFISAPLRAKGRLIGALNVLSRVPARYDADEVALVEGIANQIAIFLDNLHLHARLQQFTLSEEHRRGAHETPIIERFNHLMRGQRAGGLTPREREVLALMVVGRRNREITHILGISLYTVKKHISSIFDKLDVTDRAGAVAAAAERNLLEQANR